MLGVWEVAFAGASKTEGPPLLQFLGCQDVPGERVVKSVATVTGEGFQLVLGEPAVDQAFENCNYGTYMQAVQTAIGYGIS